MDILLKYDISENGFLSKDPIPILDSLPDWEMIVKELPNYNKERILRDAVANLSEFDVNLLTTSSHYKRAYVVLCLLTHSYVFGGEPIKSIPRKLAIPLVHVASYLGINPVLTHAAVDLYNWTLIDPNAPITLDNLQSTSLMTGTEDEERFYLTMVAIEAVGGDMIKDILSINETNALSCLTNLNDNLIKVIIILRRIREKCKPAVFYHVLRPYLAGWEPKGMIYEGISDEPIVYRGGSAAQSSLFQVLDIVFGIEHKDSYFELIRAYMPESHRNFINYVQNNISIKNINMDNEAKLVFNKCINNLALFRSCHMSIVTDYILNQASPTNEAVKGTGGTSLLTFLGEAIKETKMSCSQ